jgi:ligand-binding SRPBCC domain-containing protein
MHVHLLERSQRVAVPPERAFGFYADAGNLEPLTPPWVHFRLLTPRPIAMGSGTALDYRLRLHGVPLRWRTLIEAWEPPRYFADSQARGPYRLWQHEHFFEPDGEGATVIRDRVRYALPLGPLGAAAHRLFVRRDLERIFDFRRDGMAALLGADG